ncbi:SDR family oxidoreductase [Paraferrimonas haliotis]|uniref:NAD(P)-dependent oxidoreductase n=1 Tax=Paraferrimonas haliotis TaxID=2013866 RepID=A0AA37TJQ1_9GAMM|nr:SDR family oxidoreductase [Paraferrimonas haliotis]GLS82687.1 NAD(P)-dependent oxidoreductase [Paraferrimonas haliotis]
MTAKRVSIISCGWYGKALASHLLSKGYHVQGTRTTAAGVEELNDLGITGHELTLGAQVHCHHLDALVDCDVLIINVPPRLRAGQNDYLQKMNALLDACKHRVFERVIFISSTGVYPDTLDTATENEASAHSKSSEVMLAAESLWKAFPSVVLRFSGLIGNSRHPGRFLAGRTQLTGANSPVNLVHIDDCINATEFVLNHASPAPCYNLTTPHHPTKQVFYSEAAKQLNLEPPQFDEQSAQHRGKRVSGAQITKDGYQYIHNDLLQLLASWR